MSSAPLSSRPRGRGVDANELVHLSRCRGRDRQAASEDCGGSSVSFLTRHIQSLKKRVRRFEEQFEEEMKYKVLHSNRLSSFLF